MSDWAFVGDILVSIGIVVAAMVYRLQRVTLERQQIDATLAALHSVRKGMGVYGEAHFGGDGYSQEAADVRANQDYELVKKGSYYQNFRVPTEPIASLIQQREGWLVSRGTIEAANIALWRVGTFNQLVQQQADFNAHHLSEFNDKRLDVVQRESLAIAARNISMMIHHDAIGDAKWYHRLMAAIDLNVKVLETRRQLKWWNRRSHGMR